MNPPHFPKPLTAIILTVFLGGLLWVAIPMQYALAGTITVNTTADELNNDGNCSLREAIIAANTDAAVDACPAGSGADTIILPSGTFTFSLAGTSENDAATGDLDIKDDLTIQGAGLVDTIIDANGLDRVFELWSGSLVSITDLSFHGGNSTAAGGNIRIAESSSLSLLRARVGYTVAGSSTSIYVINGSTLEITSSRVVNSLSGGINIQAGATAYIYNSAIVNNTTDSGGGGINSSGSLTIVNSTISGNTAAFHGGGIFSGGTLDLYNVTIANNTAGTSGTSGYGGGLYTFPGDMTTMQNSILADNVNLVDGSKDCSGELTSGGYNLIEVTSGCTINGDITGNLTGSDPNLDVLGLNGGGTQTQPLLTGSPAIDAGNPSGCTDENNEALLTDQRGYVRNGVCDMGAYEYDSAGLATPTVSPTASATATQTPTSTTPVVTSTPTPTSSILPPSVFLPLILNAGTNTPTPTSTPTNTPPVPTATQTPMATATMPAEGTPPSPTPTAVEGYGYVAIIDFSYIPKVVTIHVNASVVWENFDPVDHTATSDTGAWDSGIIAPGGTFQFQFTTAGSYPYHDTSYPNMTGTIIVVP
ncbi:MAG: CSLREA domain-containing protein [Anaerolineales bacterium]|nr:CSLREA domain-containing protein [Anaerolineales bacterium]